MNRVWVTHLPHLLDNTGSIPKDISLPGKRLAKALCTFVTYATNFAGEDDEELPECFITVKRKRCKGKVLTLLTMVDDNIGWQCQVCKNYGITSGWQGTLWDLSERSELQ